MGLEALHHSCNPSLWRQVQCSSTMVATINTCGIVQVCRRPRWHQVRRQTVGQQFQREVQVANMLEPRSNFSVAVLGDRLMVMGGYR